MFGCNIEDFRRSINDSLTVKHNAGGYPMVAMSILSDSQELLALGRADQARQEINKAKWVIQEYLTTPAPAQKAELTPLEKDAANLIFALHDAWPYVHRNCTIKPVRDRISKLIRNHGDFSDIFGPSEALPPIRYRVKVRGGSWYFTDRLPSPADMASIEAIEEAGERRQPVEESAEAGAARKTQVSLDELKALWAQLGDVPIDADECLDAGFLHFENGTPREYVWTWFEQQHPDFSVAEMQGHLKRHRQS